jgi:hypothetical protein
VSYISKFGPKLSDALVSNQQMLVPGAVETRVARTLEFLWERNHISFNTPGYKTTIRQKRHTLPNNAFYSHCSVRQDPGGFVVRPAQYFENGVTIDFQQWKSGSVRTWFPAIWDSLNFRPSHTPLVTSARNMATNMVLTRVKNMKFNAAQALAERKQTAGLLINTSNRFITFALMARKGNFTGARRALGKRSKELYPKGLPRDLPEPPTRDVFSNLWLELSYGWRPLLGDIYGAAESLAQVVLKNNPTYAKGKGADEMNVFKTYFGLNTSVGVHETAIVTSRIALQYAVADSGLNALSRHGLTNPLALAWELLPYSFCVDWIYPVGTYLNNLDIASGLIFKGGWRTEKTLYSAESSGLSHVDGWKQMGSMKATQRDVTIRREALGSFPAPPMPTFRLGLNTAQIGSALALLNQAFNRR